jgi:hypothetical protein
LPIRLSSLEPKLEIATFIVVIKSQQTLRFKPDL